MKRNLEFRKKAPVIIQKGIIQSLIQKRFLLFQCICGISQPFHRSGKNTLLNVHEKMFLKIYIFFKYFLKI